MRAFVAAAIVAGSAAGAWAQGAALPASAASPAAATSAPAAVPADDGRENAVIVSHRTIATFHTAFMGRTARDRALGAGAAVRAVLERGGPGRVSLWRGSNMVGLQIDGVTVFYLVPDDVDPGTSLDQAAEVVLTRLQHAVEEVRETRDVRRIGTAVALSAVATVIAYLAVVTLFAVRRRLLTRLETIFQRWQPKAAGRSLLTAYSQHAHSAAHAVAIVVTWGAVLVVINVWITFVLRQFAFTRYWGERATDWMVGVVEQFALAAAEAVPGLLMAILIFLLGRLATRANSALMQRIERGELQVSWLDADTAGPTRRIGNFVVWLFALALAYPFLPGSNSDAFKGVSVLAGLMLSLGASGVVGQ
ncbi:MAG TPA: hypothetical protein VML58_15415, partial [Burkholderiaceae bacterium]|nr:hypothetical protein [Burkholderiaceae bacterium]